MRRALAWIAGTLLSLAALLALVLAVDALREPRPIGSEPVRRASAIDRWTPPWPASPAEASLPGARPRRWLVVGWDGASWDLILPMLEQGKLPHLAALMRRGAYGPIASFRPTLSPVLWTTVATGMTPETHGIRGFDVPRTKVQKRLWRLTHRGKLRRKLFDNTDRRSRALWNLLSDAGRRVLVVGYHNTYPAEDVRGLMVSNYLMQDLMSAWMHASGGIDPELAEALVHPAEDLPAVLEVEAEVRRGLAAALPRFADLDEAQARSVVSGAGLDPERNHRLFFLRQAYLFDTFDAEIVRRFRERVDPELTMVHFQAIDLVSHYDLYFHRPELFAGLVFPGNCRVELDVEAPRFRRTVEAFHVYLDEWLGTLVAGLPADTAVMVVSDHGFGAVANCHRPGGHEEAPPGIVVLAGPGVRQGARLSGATLYDVFPTLAATLSLPLAADLPGRPMTAAFLPGVCDPGSIPTVASYETSERYVPSVAPPAALGEEIEKQLRSLGYVK
ncbi:MAG TPA: alkaline phosphatase family protein [Candidatus Polarisedimenticolaceae bacterium]|nr:alkaline phosphatase family protein [Candidatus Polarisedimenticolaceae bacterium]